MTSGHVKTQVSRGFMRVDLLVHSNHRSDPNVFLTSFLAVQLTQRACSFALLGINSPVSCRCICYSGHRFYFKCTNSLPHFFLRKAVYTILYKLYIRSYSYHKILWSFHYQEPSWLRRGMPRPKWKHYSVPDQLPDWVFWDCEHC